MKKLDAKTLNYVIRKVYDIFTYSELEKVGIYDVRLEKIKDWQDLFSEDNKQDSSVKGFRFEYVDQSQNGEDSYSGNIGYRLGSDYCIVARFDM